ncbi:MAG: hypothetical protein ACMUIA_10615 [bacterium]
MIVCMAIFWVMVAFPSQILALSIAYELFEIGDGTWKYAYTVHNYSFSKDYGFTIYFDYGLYEDIISFDHGDDWDILTWDPRIYLGYEESGAYDALALTDEASLMDPFTVQFNWLGAGIPGSQFYSIYESNTWTELDTGITFTTPIGQSRGIVLGYAENTIQSVHIIDQNLEKISELSPGLNFVSFQVHPSTAACRSHDLIKFLSTDGDLVSLQNDASLSVNSPSPPKVGGSYLFFNKICGKNLEIQPDQVYRIYKKD